MTLSALRRRALVVPAALVGAALLLAACGGGGVTTLSAPPTTDLSLTLTLQRSPVGPVLATGAGNTLYDFAPDTPTHSACPHDPCVLQWPPLLESGPVRVGKGVNAALVGTLQRPDQRGVDTLADADRAGLEQRRPLQHTRVVQAGAVRRGVGSEVVERVPGAGGENGPHGGALQGEREREIGGRRRGEGRHAAAAAGGERQGGADEGCRDDEGATAQRGQRHGRLTNRSTARWCR